MKTTLAFGRRIHYNYTPQLFQRISQLGFRYYTNDREGIVLLHKGKWQGYTQVMEQVKELPQLVELEDFR